LLFAFSGALCRSGRMKPALIILKRMLISIEKSSDGVHARQGQEAGFE
jgi:hypothetical protein